MQPQTPKTVDIRRLKKWAAENLGLKSGLRGVLRLENDHLSVEEFLAKSTTWLNLARLEDNQ